MWVFNEQSAKRNFGENICRYAKSFHKFLNTNCPKLDQAKFDKCLGEWCREQFHTDYDAMKFIKAVGLSNFLKYASKIHTNVMLRKVDQPSKLCFLACSYIFTECIHWDDKVSESYRYEYKWHRRF